MSKIMTITFNINRCGDFRSAVTLQISNSTRISDKNKANGRQVAVSGSFYIEIDTKYDDANADKQKSR